MYSTEVTTPPDRLRYLITSRPDRWGGGSNGPFFLSRTGNSPMAVLCRSLQRSLASFFFVLSGYTQMRQQAANGYSDQGRAAPVLKRAGAPIKCGEHPAGAQPGESTSLGSGFPAILRRFRNEVPANRGRCTSIFEEAAVFAMAEPPAHCNDVYP